MISQTLNTIFQKSIQLARELRHDILTIEHIFYLAISTPEGMNIIEEAGGEISVMQEKMYKYITTQIQQIPQDAKNDPIESMALSRAIENMLNHTRSSGQKSGI